MTMPELIWADDPDIFDGVGIWHEDADGGTEYVRADLHDATKAQLAKAVAECDALSIRANRAEKHELHLQEILAATNANSADGASALYKLTSFKEPMYVNEWKKLNAACGDIVDDLVDVMEWLRDIKAFGPADRIRTLAGRLARGRTVMFSEGEDLVRVVARTYDNQLSPKESRKIIAERDAALAALAEIEKGATQ